MDITKETKASLATQLEVANKSISAAKAEVEQARLVAQSAVNIANQFSFNLSTIESLLLNSPIGKGKFVKTLWFFITNWKQLAQLIEGILEQIRLYKQKMDELKEAANNPA